MKNVLIGMALLLNLGVFAQKEGHRFRGDLEEMSTEQLASLHTKKMTLALDLDEAQQEQVMELHLEEVANKKEQIAQRRESKEKADGKLSADERYALANARLDRKLELQERMKEILTTEQYQNWKKHQQQMRCKKKMKRRGERE